MTVTISLNVIDVDYYSLIARMRGMTMDQYMQRAAQYFAPVLIKEVAQLSNQHFEGKS